MKMLICQYKEFNDNNKIISLFLGIYYKDNDLIVQEYIV